MKTADKIAVSSGDIVTFRLTLTNQGPDTATGVEVSDRLPAGVIYQQDQPQQGAYDALTGSWKVGDVPANTSVTLLLIVRIK